MGPSSDDVLIASVSDLVSNFRSAMLALLPVADLSMLGWRDDEMHPDWEKLSECLFDVFVRGPVDADSGRAFGELPLARYDIDLEDYSTHSWVGVCSGAGTTYMAFVRFVSQVEAFDAVQVVEVDPVTGATGRRQLVAWCPNEIVLVRREPDHADCIVRMIEAVE
jgi:hypothetical protein